MKRYTFLVRRTPNHACVAHTKWGGDPPRMYLLRLTPDAGEVPAHAHLVGQPFPCRRDLRAAIKALMRGQANHPENENVQGTR